MRGTLSDQPALYGVIARIRDLGLTLISLLVCQLTGGWWWRMWGIQAVLKREKLLCDTPHA